MALETFEQVVDAMQNSGTIIAQDVIEGKLNGCFEFCDGWPSEELGGGNILAQAIQLNVSEPLDKDAAATLLERAKHYPYAAELVTALCKSECKGVNSLFEQPEDKYDSYGNAIVKACPLKARLAEVAIQANASL